MTKSQTTTRRATTYQTRTVLETGVCQCCGDRIQKEKIIPRLSTTSSVNHFKHNL